MCGIAGIIDPSLSASALRPRVETMCARMTHRGPDDGGCHARNGAALGMRRLSIIDLSGGQQPIISSDKRFCLVFNGEIYNYQPLREELKTKGHHFQTQSDTEVILHLFEEEGTAAFTRLRGQFALAILDLESSELHVARDHLGIKPLYYASINDRLYFASEIKCLRALGLGREINPEGVAQFLSLRYILAPATIHKDIRKLEPGHYLRWQDGRLEERAFWTLAFPESACDLPEETLLEETRERLRESVALRMQADVPFGAFLSGGLDSSMVVALMSERIERVRTFSVGFRRRGYNEYAFSRKVARAYATQHLEYTVGAEEFDHALKQFQAFTDEPIGDPAFIPLFCLAEKAAREVKVVLSGEGADELFAGYDRYVKMLEQPGQSEDETFATYMRGCSYFLDEPPEACLHPDQAGNFLPVRERLRQLYDRTRGTSYLNRFLWFDLKTWIPDNLLVKADRMGMAHSLEVRVPFLDIPFLEHLARVPEALKARKETRKKLFGEEAFWNVKVLLKKAAAGLVPGPVIQRTKVGFPVPVRRFLKGDLKRFAQSVLSSRELRETGLFRPGYVEDLARTFVERGKSSWPAWTLFCFELWRRAVEEDDRANLNESHAKTAHPQL